MPVLPGALERCFSLVQRLLAAEAAPGTPAPPILGPIVETTHPSVGQQLDRGTGSEQPVQTRPQVLGGQLPRFSDVAVQSVTNFASYYCIYLIGNTAIRYGLSIRFLFWASPR